MSVQVGNQNVDFLMTRLDYSMLDGRSRDCLNQMMQSVNGAKRKNKHREYQQKTTTTKQILQPAALSYMYPVYFLFAITSAGAVPCGGPKTSLRPLCRLYFPLGPLRSGRVFCETRINYWFRFIFYTDLFFFSQCGLYQSLRQLSS